MTSYELDRDLVPQRLPDRKLNVVELRRHPHFIVARTRQADVEYLLGIAGALFASVVVPQMIRGKIKELVDTFLGRRGLTREAMAAFILHPGGQKLLRYVEEQLGLCRCDTQLSWDVLGQYGNLSSATILFILHAWLTTKNMNPGDYGLAAAFGPGFSAELLLLQWD